MKHTKHWMYLKWSAIVFWSLFLLVVVIINVGCTRTEYINNTVTINNTITINKTIKIPCNLTFSKEREMELIRRLKFCENQQDKLIMDETECDNNTKANYEGKIDMYKRDIEELEDELENCEEGFCEYNESWC